MWNKIKDFYHQIEQGVRNLIVYFPVIWNDRNWGEHYIYMMLHRKLELKERFFRGENVYSANAEEVANEIKLIKEALDRLIKDNYFNKELIANGYDEKYGGLECFDIDENGFLYDSRPEEAQELFKQASDRGYEREQKDKEFVFDYMKDKIEGWWD